MPRPSLSVVFAGSGGAGAMTAGAVVLRAAARAGYYGLMTQLFGPQVRGGEAAALLQISIEPVLAQPDRFDLFVALDWDKVDQFAPEIPLDAASIVLADPAAGPIPTAIARSKARMLDFAMADPAGGKSKRAGEGRRVNMFAAGAVAALAGLTIDHMRGAIAEVIGHKGADITETNLAAALAGATAAATLRLDLKLVPATPAARWLISGNEAIALGALRGGVRFVGCYPITPATDLVEWLAPELQKLGGKLVLAEDELAAINMVLGASQRAIRTVVQARPGRWTQRWTDDAIETAHRSELREPVVRLQLDQRGQPGLHAGAELGKHDRRAQPGCQDPGKQPGQAGRVGGQIRSSRHRQQRYHRHRILGRVGVDRQHVQRGRCRGHPV